MGQRPRFRRQLAGLGVETKFFDTSNVEANLGTDIATGEKDPATLDCISCPAQGDGEQDRDGKKIVITSVHVNGIVNLDADNANSGTIEVAPVVMVALVQDTQTNGAQADSSLVFKNTSTNAKLCSSPMRNLQYNNRFKVLSVWRYAFPAPAIMYNSDAANSGLVPTYVYPGVNQRFSFNKKVRIPVNFTGTSSVIANVVDNSLHIIAYVSHTTRTPQLSYNARIRFQG